MIEGFEDFVTDQVTIEPFVSEGPDGLRTYGAPVAYDAVVQGPQRKMIQPDGAVLVEPGVIFIGPELLSLDARSRITLPGITLPPAIIAADKMPIGPDMHHWEIRFK